MIEMRTKFLVGLGVLFLQAAAFAEGGEPQVDWAYAKETAEQHAEKMDWWNDARFGMFMHWGAYSKAETDHYE